MLNLVLGVLSGCVLVSFVGWWKPELGFVPDSLLFLEERMDVQFVLALSSREKDLVQAFNKLAYCKLRPLYVIASIESWR